MQPEELKTENNNDNIEKTDIDLNELENALENFIKALEKPDNSSDNEIKSNNEPIKNPIYEK